VVASVILLLASSGGAIKIWRREDIVYVAYVPGTSASREAVIELVCGVSACPRLALQTVQTQRASRGLRLDRLLSLSTPLPGSAGLLLDRVASLFQSAPTYIDKVRPSCQALRYVSVTKPRYSSVIFSI